MAKMFFCWMSMFIGIWTAHWWIVTCRQTTFGSLYEER
ncbi:hypothetical protein AHF37_12310 [Paragonimus kellicotti]|nr:hypothetical protein AHF37_12310 [Paragonimus kellicotti]